MNIEKLAIEHGAVHYSPPPMRAVKGLSFTFEQLEAFAKAYAQQQTEPVACKYGNEPKSCTSSPMDCQCALDATLNPPATVPEGYALLPIKPDSKYLTDVALAIGKLLESVGINTFDINEWCGTYNIAKTAHKAMLSASPTPPNAVPLEKYNKLLDALKHAHLFIRNGIELGYISMPEEQLNDPASKTPSIVEQAIAEAEGKEG